jgi:Ca2+-binding RTX toxin-like protein
MDGVLARDDGSVYVAGWDDEHQADRANLYRLQPDSSPPGPINLDPSGTLSIVGTDSADWIEVLSHQNQQLNWPQIMVSLRGGFGRSFDTAEVSLISISAEGGNDVVWLRQTAGLPATVSGGDGDDKLAGADGDDSLSGNAGRDCIDGGGGNDRLAGNGSRDKLSGADGADRLYGGSSGDWLAGQNGDDQLFGEGGNDRLAGGDDSDVLHGNANDDSFFTAGDGAIDQIFGDGGRDFAEHDDDDLLTSIEIR